MNLRVAHNGEDQEMDVVADGEARKPSRPNLGHHRLEDGVNREAVSVTDHDADMTASLLRAIQRDPNPNGRWKGALLSEDGTQLLIDTADGRTFILTVREV